MDRKTVGISIARFWPGATVEEIVGLVLCDLTGEFDFRPSDDPDLILYGPYNGQPPAAGRGVRVFIGSENVRPLMGQCDWAFGVAHDHVIGHPRYMRIARWGAEKSYRQESKDWGQVLAAKTKFCMFLFAHRVPFREAFFTALSRYKHVDAPGRSMNNMAPIDAGPSAATWQNKVDVLRDYKFVIAFENSTTPGYNTEKLTHPIEADSMPIYWGDPEIGRSFNERRFINAHRFMPPQRPTLPRVPYHYHSLAAHDPPTVPERVGRRINRAITQFEQSLWSLGGFDRLVAEVVRLDQDDEAYLEQLRQPFLIGDREPDLSAWIERWRTIIEQGLARR
jgi:hypothetical protein